MEGSHIKIESTDNDSDYGQERNSDSHLLEDQKMEFLIDNYLANCVEDLESDMDTLLDLGLDCHYSVQQLPTPTARANQGGPWRTLVSRAHVIMVHSTLYITKAHDFRLVGSSNTNTQKFGVDPNRIVIYRSDGEFFLQKVTSRNRYKLFIPDPTKCQELVQRLRDLGFNIN